MSRNSVRQELKGIITFEISMVKLRTVSFLGFADELAFTAPLASLPVSEVISITCRFWHLPSKRQRLETQM